MYGGGVFVVVAVMLSMNLTGWFTLPPLRFSIGTYKIFTLGSDYGASSINDNAHTLPAKHPVVFPQQTQQETQRQTQQVTQQPQLPPPRPNLKLPPLVTQPKTVEKDTIPKEKVNLKIEEPKLSDLKAESEKVAPIVASDKDDEPLTAEELKGVTDTPLSSRTRVDCKLERQFKVNLDLDGQVPYHRTIKGLQRANHVAQMVATDIAGRKTITVVSVNAGYADFVKNLMCSIRALKVDKHGNRPKLLLVAVDNKVSDMIKDSAEDGGHYVYNINDEAKAELPDSDSNQDYGTSKFEWVVLQRTRLISDFLHLGYDVLGGDADEVFIKNPFAYLEENYATSTKDMLAQPEADGRQCIGYILYRNTPSMRKVYSLLLKNQECLVWQCFKNGINKLQGDTGDQLTMLQITNFLKPNTENFPADKFPWGSKFFDGNTHRSIAQMPIVVHNNYIIGKAAKLKRFRDYNIWLLDQQGQCRVEKGKTDWYPLKPV